ncbi:hypothetical protein ACFE04_006588 [Oxalis oulophora]
MTKMISIQTLSVFGLLLISSCFITQGNAQQVKAAAVLESNMGVSGTIYFHQDGAAHTIVYGKITGLRPGQHGIHIHEFGNTGLACLQAGGHFNPFGKSHGGPQDDNRHAGDLGNIVAGDDGVASFNIENNQIPLSGANNIMGRAVVVHADADDFGKGGKILSTTTGNAGARVACGVIVQEGA